LHLKKGKFTEAARLAAARHTPPSAIHLLLCRVPASSREPWERARHLDIGF
jgi:hypothetical protein